MPIFIPAWESFWPRSTTRPLPRPTLCKRSASIPTWHRRTSTWAWRSSNRAKPMRPKSISTRPNNSTAAHCRAASPTREPFLPRLRAMNSAVGQSCFLCRNRATRLIATCDRTVRIQSCGLCGVEFAVYPPDQRPDRDHFDGLDVEMYARSVQATREASYDELLAHVSAVRKGGRWLDVGCSYGWLLKRVQAAGFEGYGVEPSPGAAQKAHESGLKVMTGSFPTAVGDGPPYSVVSFMDVLEHLPDPISVLERTGRFLNQEGVVVIQVPDRSCLLYWLARALCRWSGGRLDFALRRLWLTDLDFPHRFYFSRRSLERVCSRSGFEIIDWYRAAIGAPGQARDRVGYLKGKRGAALPWVSTGVAAITALDNLWKHGGLLVVIARPKRSP